QIHWGDGQTSPGLIVRPATGPIEIVGDHTYALDGSYSISVDIQDKGGSKLKLTGKAHVADAALLGQGTTLKAAAHQPLGDATIATFPDTGGALPASAYSATIRWGDSTADGNATIKALGDGQFAVVASYIYNASGSYSPTVFIHDNANQTIEVH